MSCGATVRGSGATTRRATRCTTRGTATSGRTRWRTIRSSTSPSTRRCERRRGGNGTGRGSGRSCSCWRCWASSWCLPSRCTGAASRAPPGDRLHPAACPVRHPDPARGERDHLRAVLRGQLAGRHGAHAAGAEARHPRGDRALEARARLRSPAALRRGLAGSGQGHRHDLLPEVREALPVRLRPVRQRARHWPRHPAADVAEPRHRRAGAPRRASGEHQLRVDDGLLPCDLRRLQRCRAVRRADVGVRALLHHRRTVPGREAAHAGTHLRVRHGARGRQVPRAARAHRGGQRHRRLGAPVPDALPRGGRQGLRAHSEGEGPGGGGGHVPPRPAQRAHPHPHRRGGGAAAALPGQPAHRVLLRYTGPGLLYDRRHQHAGFRHRARDGVPGIGALHPRPRAHRHILYRSSTRGSGCR